MLTSPACPPPARRSSCVARLLGALGLAALINLPGPAVAAWPPAGVQVCQSCVAWLPVVVADGTGGAYVAWQDQRAANGNADVYVQRITPTGEIAPGWPADGVPVCTDPGNQFLSLRNPAVNDGFGGIIIPWTDYRDFVPGGTLEDIYAQRILPDGSIAPGWTPNGVPVRRAASRDDGPVLIADGAGGAFFSWYDNTDKDIYVQYLTGAGAVAPGWPEGGLPVCVLPGLQLRPQLAPDGTGGVFVAWEDFRDSPYAVYAHRVTAAGQNAPGWPENGARIVLARGFGGLVADGAGGAYVSCFTPGQVHEDDYYLQRFLGDGSIAPGWPDGGVPICLAPDERSVLSMVPDGVGGVLLTWSDYRGEVGNDIFALRVRPDGTLQPGWPVDGLRVTDDTSLDDLADLAPNGTGGAYLTWDHYTTALGDRVVVQHLTGAGAVAPGWPNGGAQIPSDISSGLMRVTEDGMGGAFVAWHTAYAGDEKVRILRYNADGPVAVAISLVSAEAEPGRVRLTWYAADAASLVATVERRTDMEEWRSLDAIHADGTGKLAYEDRAVAAGIRYGYRLAYADGAEIAHTPETWVTVPVPRFALRGLTPNPSAGDPVVAFTLAGNEPAALDLYDLNGRRVLSRELGTLGPGQHAVRLEAGGRLAAGVYTIRLRQGVNMASVRAVIVR